MHGLETLIRLNAEAAEREAREDAARADEHRRLMEDTHYVHAIERFEDEGGREAPGFDLEGVDEGSY